MPTARIDRAEVLECVSKYGTIIRLIKGVRVIGLVNVDHTALITALTAAGVPLEGSTLSGAPDVILTERSVKMIDETTADVILTYEHALNEGQSLDAPHFGGGISTENEASVNQVETNLDAQGVPITVEHTYPDTDADFPSQKRLQGGKISFMQPQRIIRFEGIKQTPVPELLSAFLIGAVNISSWAGGGPREWLCTSVNYKAHSSSPIRYLMKFEFQHNPDTWDPQVVFEDERSGKPPTDLIEGTGYKTIEKQRQVNFEGIIGTRIQGG